MNFLLYKYVLCCSSYASAHIARWCWSSKQASGNFSTFIFCIHSWLQ